MVYLLFIIYYYCTDIYLIFITQKNLAGKLSQLDYPAKKILVANKIYLAITEPLITNTMSNNTMRNSGGNNKSRNMNNNTFSSTYGDTIKNAIYDYLKTIQQNQNLTDDEFNNIWYSVNQQFKIAFETNTAQSATIDGNRVTVGFNADETAYINTVNERKASNMQTRRLSNAGLEGETSTNSPVQPRRQSNQRVLQLKSLIAGETGTDPTPMRRGAVTRLLTPSQLRAKRPPPPVPGSRPVPTRKAPNRPLPARPVTSASEYVYYNPTAFFMPGNGNNTKRKCLNRQNQTRKINNCKAYLKTYGDWQQNDYKYRDIYKAYNQIRSELDPNQDYYNRTQVLPTLSKEMVHDAERKIRAEIKRPDSIIGYFLRKKASQEKYRKVIKDFVTKLYNFYKTCTDNQCSIDTVSMYGITLYTFAKQTGQIKITQYNTLNDYLREKHAFCKKNKATCKSGN